MRVIVVAVLAAAGLAGCATGLKEPRWHDEWTAAPRAWVFEPGLYRLKPGQSLDVRSDGLTYRQTFGDIVIEATEPEGVEASEHTKSLEGGRRYRIVSIRCDAGWTPCPMLQTNTELYITPATVARTPLVAYETPRVFEGVYISIDGGSMRTRGGYERARD